MNKIKTTIKKFNVDWQEIKNACRQTVGMADSSVEPTKEWKKKLLICRHSPIRLGTVLWKWSEIPFFVMGHFVRHNVGCTPFVQTSRSDRTNIPRETRKQTDPVSMEMDANIEGLINIAGRRLCTCADPTTREYTEDLREQIEKYDDTIAWAMVPQCVRAGGCCEPFSQCKYYENFAKTLSKEEQMDLVTRLDKYNEYRGKILSLTKKKQD